ncbi:FkbM family methyltransferase [Halotia wernerae UHCC 0503]|nr:FkbM family methyltransferase [Halotia wernerae UHCC 0503]
MQAIKNKNQIARINNTRLFKYLHRDGDSKLSLFKVILRQLSEWFKENKQAKEQFSKKDYKVLSHWLREYHLGMFYQPLISDDTSVIELTANNFPVHIEFRNNHSDLYILRENFIQRIYDFEYEKIIRNVKNIVDLGANIGLSSLFFQSRFPSAQIVCVEPVEQNVKILKKNAENNKFSWVIEKVAIQSKAGSVTLYPNAWWSSSTVSENVASKRESNEDRLEHLLKLPSEVVPSFPVNAILDKHNIDIVDVLKMDIEGAEEGVILNSSEWLNRVKILIIEIHDKYVNRYEITKVLIDAGFERMVGREGPTDVFINKKLIENI